MLKSIIMILSEKYKGEMPEKTSYFNENVEIHIQRIQDKYQTEVGEYLGDVLYITDVGPVCSILRNENLPVIALLQEYNKEESFSATKYAIESLEDLEYEYLERVFLRFQKLPWKIAETKRCIMREMAVSDVEEIRKLYKQNTVLEQLGDFGNSQWNDNKMDQTIMNLQEKEQADVTYIQEYMKHVYEFYEFGIWLIEEKQTGRIIGRAGIEIGEEDGEALLGYLIEPLLQRQGYAYEVCQEIIEIAREEYGFEKISVIIDEQNIPSRNLAKKLGFIYERESQKQEKIYIKYNNLLK